MRIGNKKREYKKISFLIRNRINLVP